MNRVLYLASLALVPALLAAPIVRDGKPAAVVVLPPDADAVEKLAAKELIDHVEKMSGARLETATALPMDKTAVVLGRAALPQVEKALSANPGSFVLKATKDAVLIAGVGDGTHFGVCELLEQ